MEFNISASRLIEPVEFLTQPVGSDDYGQPLPRTVSFVARADVDIKGGNQLVKLGEQMTTELITCLMWYDPRALNSGWVRVYGIEYEVQHVRTSPKKTAMIITAKVERNEIPSPVIPTTRLVPKPNGVSQYATTPDINMIVGDVLHFDIIAPTSLSANIRMLISDNSAFQTRVRVEPNGSIALGRGTLTIDGVTATTMPLDGALHKCAFTATQTTKVNLFAAQSDGSGGFLRFCDFPIFNVKLNDGSIFNYAMNDGFANNPVMINSGSGGNGQYVNATESMWIEVDL